MCAQHPTYNRTPMIRSKPGFFIFVLYNIYIYILTFFMLHYNTILVYTVYNKYLYFLNIYHRIPECVCFRSGRTRTYDVKIRAEDRTAKNTSNSFCRRTMCGQNIYRPESIAMFTLLALALVNVRGECI